MGASNVKWVRLGDYIEQCDERNSASINYPVIGINRDKTFMPTVANLDGVDIAKYKIVTKGMFVFSGMQTGRDICIRIGLYDNEQPALVSPAYTTFVINDDKKVLPEYFSCILIESRVIVMVGSLAIPVFEPTWIGRVSLILNFHYHLQTSNRKL